MKQNVCVISVHPDDETLGCGGTLLKHRHSGDSINCIFVTNGNDTQKSIINKLTQFYGFSTTISLNLLENKLSDIPLGSIIDLLSSAINQIKPTIMYIPNRSDAHSDHRTTFDAVAACSKSFRYPYIKRILMCEVVSETDFAPALPENIFIPNVFVDISDYSELKKEAVGIFYSELLEAPCTRSYNAINALETYRGSQINANKAEAFMLIKAIE